MNNYTPLIEKALEYRKKHLNDDAFACYRLINSSNDQFPGITVDVYGDYLLVQYFSKTFLSYLDDITEALLDVLQGFHTVKGIALKDRTPSTPGEISQDKRISRTIYGEIPTDSFPVEHNGVRLYADIFSAQNTGVFFDMRETRDKLKPFYSEVSSILNLFCYTSAFSIHGLRNGVKHTVNVDISKQVLDRSKENFKLNSLEVDQRDFIKLDAKLACKQMLKAGKKFDLVIFDPPTFARNKKAHFSVKRDYTTMLSLIAQISNKYVLSAINCHTITKEQYTSYHPKKWKQCFYHHESADFVHDRKPYLKCGLWQLF